MDLTAYPPGSVVATCAGNVVLTGYMHLLHSDGGAGARVVRTACGKEGLPYVWRGEGLRASWATAGVTCPACKGTDLYRLKRGET